MFNDETFQNIIERRNTRRGLLKSAIAGAAGLAGAGLLARSADATAAPPPPINDAAILNFALNLEYLEAEYYTYAVTGNSIEALGIATTGSGTPGPITIKDSPKVMFSDTNIAQFAAEIADDEQTHVKFLRTALSSFGVQPVARPAVDLLNSFNTLAGAAFGPGSTFDPFASDTNFLLGAYIFEDVGVSAYHGAAGLLKNKDVLGAAAGILGIEAYHAGLIRTVLFQQGQGAATQAISNVRLSLGGAVDYGVNDSKDANGNPTSSVVLSDSNALAATRTARQVLNIVYGAQNATSGLFFPSGLNGPIR